MSKKIFGLFLVCCMLITAIMPMTVSAAGLLTVAGNDVLEFYDNDSETQSLESGNGTNSVILKNNEWVKYDISSLEEGTYKVTLKYASKASNWKDFAYGDALVDGVLLERRRISDTQSAQSFTSIDFCNIFISEGSKEFTFRNSAQHITPPNEKGDYIPRIDVESITFTLISKSDISDGLIISNAAQNVINTTFGDGFYDANCLEDYSSNNATQNIVAQKTVTSAWQHVGDYSKYDISELKSGVYKLTLKAGTRVNHSKLNVYIDDEKVVDAKELIYDATTTGVLEDGTESINDFGQIFIPENAEVLKFENAEGQTYGENFTLKYIGNEFSQDEKKINALAFVGGDILNGEGVGYHDPIKTDGSLEISYGRYVVARDGKWLKYDVTGLKGYYKVSMYATGGNGSTIKSMNYYVNDNPIAQNSETDITFTDAYVTYEMRDLGVVKLDGGENQTLKLEFDVLTGAAYFEYIYLEKVSLFDLERKTKTFTVTNAVENYNLSGTQGYIRNNTEFVLNTSEWFSFDALGLWGAYEVTMNASGGTTSKITSVTYSVGNKSTTNTVDVAFTNYETYKSYNLGNVIFSGEDNQIVKIAPTISGASYVKSFTFTPCEIDETEISAPNVSAGGEGIGYHDLKGSLSLVSGGKEVAFNDTEWVKYDVPFIEGLYEIKAVASGNDGGKITKATISVNGKEQNSFAKEIKFTGYSNYEERTLGYVKLNGGVEQNISIAFRITGASYVNKFILTRVSDAEINTVYSDTNGLGIASVGANTSVKANAVVANGNDESKTIMVIVAKYSGVKLITAVPKIVTIDAENVEVISETMPVAQGENLKVMVWDVLDGETTLEPASEAKTIS